MNNYLSFAYLQNRKNINMPIIKALLKYGQVNFGVLIIEYVTPSNLYDVPKARETYYISKLLPYYNVLKEGSSSLGFKHTESTKQTLSDLAKNRKHSDITKSLISKALIGENNPFYKNNHSNDAKLKMIEANSAYPFYIYNSYKKLIVEFPSSALGNKHYLE